MNDDSLAIAKSSTSDYESDEDSSPNIGPEIPDYLRDTYWWAYLHPRAVRIFEREWLVNLILWGNMRHLTRAVENELRDLTNATVLQVACVYGDFSNRIASTLAETDSKLHIADVAPIQISNAEAKLKSHTNVSLHHQDASNLQFRNRLFDATVLFFLLHEQPANVRRQSIEEAIRVTRSGGKVIVIDYHRPDRGSLLHVMMRPVLSWLEPFALDLWRHELVEFLPSNITTSQLDSEYWFQGLYQKVVITT